MKPLEEEAARKIRKDIETQMLDPVVLAQDLAGAKVYNVDLDADVLRGFTNSYADGNSAIYVANNQTNEWKRYVIVKSVMQILNDFYTKHNDIDLAEALDWILGEGAPDIDDDSTSDSLARTILIDEESLKKNWHTYHDVEYLANIYRVPKEIMLLRLADIGAINL